MHGSQPFLPEVLLLLIIIVAQEYYTEIRTFHEKARDFSIRPSKREYYLDMYHDSIKYFRGTMAGLAFVLLSIGLSILYEARGYIFMIIQGQKDMPLIISNISWLHFFSSFLLTAILALLLIYVVLILSKGFFMDYKPEEEIRKEIELHKELLRNDRIRSHQVKISSHDWVYSFYI